MKYLFLLLITTFSSCTTYIPRVDYCERLDGRIYCDDETFDTNYYPACSIYDNRKSCRSEDYRR